MLKSPFIGVDANGCFCIKFSSECSEVLCSISWYRWIGVCDYHHSVSYACTVHWLKKHL